MLAIGLVLLLSSGCIGRKSLNYLNDPSLSNGSSKLFENRKFEYRLQVNDVLSIRVMGLDDATSKFFNVESQGSGAMVTDAAKKDADGIKAKMIAGTFDIFKGPLKDNKGKEVIPAGKSLKQTDMTLEGMNYLVEGVIGSI